MPAPPPESDVAMVRQRGTGTSLPSPVRTGSGSTGVISAPKSGHPGSAHSSFNSGMATAAALWDDLLQGEELAHLETVPAADPRLAPLPAELDPRVRDALTARGLDSLYAHPALAWAAAVRGQNPNAPPGPASRTTLAFPPP